MTLAGTGTEGTEDGPSFVARFTDPFGVAVVVPGDPALPGRRRDEAAGLVVADGVDRDVARGRELLHAIPHDR